MKEPLEIARRLVEETLSEINKDLPKQNQIEFSDQSALVGKESSMDSVSLINLIVGVEKRILKEFDREIKLADERATLSETSPFSTFGTLVSYLSELLSEKASS